MASGTCHDHSRWLEQVKMATPVQQVVMQEYVDTVRDAQPREAVLAELGDITRFDSPSPLMAYLGLVPSEYSSGGSKHQGGITKTGNGHVRRILVEAA